MLKFIQRHKKRLAFLIRLFLGFIFLGAGMSKLYSGHDFPGIIGPVWLEERLAEYGLGLFARFIALSQVTAGVLLITQRFATLGAIITFPLILCILMVTISQKWTGTPYVNAFLLMLNAYLLFIDFHKLKFILSDDKDSLKKIPLQRKDKKGDLLWLLAVMMVFMSIPLSYMNLIAAWSLCGLAFVLIIYLQTLRKKNFKSR